MTLPNYRLKIMSIYKKYSLKFHSVFLFFLLFLFGIYKIVDGLDVYSVLNISIGTVMKNPEMLEFFPDHLKTKKMCKYAVEKLHLIY